MNHYDVKPAEVPVNLTPTELKALREAAQALGYNLPGLTTATQKLNTAIKASA